MKAILMYEIAYVSVFMHSVHVELKCIFFSYFIFLLIMFVENLTNYYICDN